MSDPYYPYSHLAKSTIYGYYFLFVMFSLIFVFVYPILSYFEGDNLVDLTILKLIQTNMMWDTISFILFLFVAIIFIKKPILQLPFSLYVVSSIIVFVCGPMLIISTYSMYFTDRIFIVVIGCNFGAKSISYMLDIRSID